MITNVKAEQLKDKIRRLQREVCEFTSVWVKEIEGCITNGSPAANVEAALKRLEEAQAELRKELDKWR